MKVLHTLSYTFLWAGGLNWGLVGLFNYNLVEDLLGTGSLPTKLIYVLVGAATVCVVGTHRTDCNICGKTVKKD